MSFPEDVKASLESLSKDLQKKYALLRDLDENLQETQRQNEQRCEQEIEEIKKGVKAGHIMPDSPLGKFSDDALEERKHIIRIADEKVALAKQAYEMVDLHVQQLDQYFKQSNEELQREEDNAATTASRASSHGGSPKLGSSGKRGKAKPKKTGLASVNTSAAVAAATEAAAAAAGGVDLYLPIDKNEPTYCICKQVSFGEMIGCDNDECEIEWFHFGCVGLREHPKGDWYCPDCAPV